jgi:nucleoid DNA-binding protein
MSVFGKGEMIEGLRRLYVGGRELTRAEATLVVDELLAQMRSAIVGGADVRLPHVGTLAVVRRAARSGIAPNGMPYESPEHATLGVRPAADLLDALNGG